MEELFEFIIGRRFMTEQELQQLIPILETIVTAFEEKGFETSLQRAAITSIQKEQGASFKLVGSKYTTSIRTALCEQESLTLKFQQVKHNPHS